MGDKVMGKCGAAERRKAKPDEGRVRVMGKGWVDEEGRLREEESGGRGEGSRVEDVINGGVVGRKTRGRMGIM